MQNINKKKNMKNTKNIMIVITCIIAVGGGSFYGGIKYQKLKSHQNSFVVQDEGGMKRFNVNRPFQGIPNGVARGQNGGGFVNGEIVSKDDSSITVKSQDGSSKIIYFSSSTTVGRTTNGSASDLAAGEQIIVNGKANSDGSIVAQNIQIRPESPAPATNTNSSTNTLSQ